MVPIFNKQDFQFFWKSQIIMEDECTLTVLTRDIMPGYHLYQAKTVKILKKKNESKAICAEAKLHHIHS